MLILSLPLTASIIELERFILMANSAVSDADNDNNVLDFTP